MTREQLKDVLQDIYVDPWRGHTTPGAARHIVVVLVIFDVDVDITDTVFVPHYYIPTAIAIALASFKR